MPIFVLAFRFDGFHVTDSFFTQETDLHAEEESCINIVGMMIVML
jgi:hypothetical protein